MAIRSADSWLLEFETCEQLHTRLLEEIHNRDKLKRNGENHIKLNSQLRQDLKKFSANIVTLRQNLIRSSSHITQMEGQRREVMLDRLDAKQKNLNDAFHNTQSTVDLDRHELYGSNFSNAGSSNWNVHDTDETRNMSISDFKTQRQRILEEQDRGLDALHDVIVSQKLVARAIGDEVDVQNEIIDDIIDHVDNTRERLIKETRHVKIIDRKTGTCAYWIAIILFLIAIVVVVSLPKPK